MNHEKEHEIVNDASIDAIKDNYKPPRMTEIRKDAVEHLFYVLGISFESFFEDIKKNGEYLKDSGKIFFWTKDVAQALKQAEQRGYRQGHIDHQLILEAGSKEIVERLLDKSKKKAGEVISISADEIIREAEQRGVEKERERCLKVVSRYKCLCDGLGGCILCRILTAIRSTKEEV